MMRSLFLLLLFVATAMAAPHPRNLQTSNWNQIGQDIVGQARGAQSGWAVSMSEDGSRVAVAAPQENLGNGENSGSVRVFQYISNLWVLLGNPIQGIAGSGTGQSVSLSGDGNTLCVGSIRLYPYKGFIVLYRWENNVWRRLTQIDGSYDRDQFGASVSLNFDGTLLAVGAPRGANEEDGLTEVYQQGNDDTDWFLIDAITFSDKGRSGYSVALSGDGTTLVIGAPYADPSNNLEDAGTTRVYRNNFDTVDSTYTALGNPITGVASGDQSGSSVSISSNGNIIAIGSPAHSSLSFEGGMVRVYSYNGNNWILRGNNIYPDSSLLGPGTRFGQSVSLSSNGNTLAVGEPYDQGVDASVYYFRSGAWNLDGTRPSTTQPDRFTYSVALSGLGNRLAVGGYNELQSGVVSGVTRIWENADRATTLPPITTLPPSSGWSLTVSSFRSDFSTGTTPEFKLTYQGTAPTIASGRTFKVTVHLSGCKLGFATNPDAIAPLVPTGAVPSTQSFQLNTELNVDPNTIKSSGYYADTGVGEGSLKFCVQMEVFEAGEARVELFADTSVDLIMGQEFIVHPLLSRDDPNKGVTTTTIEIKDVAQFMYGFEHYFCDQFGYEVGDPKVGQNVPPGGEISVCLEADTNEPVLVDNVKSVFFSNLLVPQLKVPLIDEVGVPFDRTTGKDCSFLGVCRISAITVPGLYENVDYTGTTRDVTDGAALEGIVTFAYPNRRNLQGVPHTAEIAFRVELDLARPPNRNAVGGHTSSASISCYPSLMVWTATSGLLFLAF